MEILNQTKCFENIDFPKMLICWFYALCPTVGRVATGAGGLGAGAPAFGPSVKRNEANGTFELEWDLLIVYPPLVSQAVATVCTIRCV